MKILSNGIAVIEGDTHLSKWVEDSGTLRIAEAYMKPFRKYVPVGGVVFDVGACIGDHTATYADWVGPEGLVLAIEPNEEAAACLFHNMEHLPVACFQHALSDKEGNASIVRDKNAGASYLIETNSTKGIPLFTLDEIVETFCHNKVDFIKIDAEGFETKILLGACDTIHNQRPVMLIEVNAGALERAGTSKSELLELIEHFKYRHEITDSRLTYESPQFDVICVPVERTE